MKMVELFAIVLLGYFANKVGIFPKEAKQWLSKLIINVTLPATILSSVMNSMALPSPSQILSLMFFAFFSYVVYFVVAKITVWLMPLKDDEKGVAEFALIFGNVGFIGFPVTSSIFGQQALFYTSVFNMPFHTFAYSYGTSLIKKSSNSQKGRTNIVGLFLNACMVASIIIIIMALVGWKGPRTIANVAELVGSITTPGALLIIGSSLAEMKIKEMFSNLKCYPLALVKMGVMPLVCYFCFAPFSSDALLLGDATIISAMPVATAGTMLCIEHNGNEKFMSQLTFITTLLSVIVTPIVATLL